MAGRLGFDPHSLAAWGKGLAPLSLRPAAAGAPPHEGEMWQFSPLRKLLLIMWCVREEVAQAGGCRKIPRLTP
jgi:hypothetical protein